METSRSAIVQGKDKGAWTRTEAAEIGRYVLEELEGLADRLDMEPEGEEVTEERCGPGRLRVRKRGGVKKAPGVWP